MSRGKGKLDGQGVINRDVNSAQRAVMALSMRAKKMTYEQIAPLCGYANPGSCRKAVLRELDRVVVRNVEELRNEEAMTLDLMQGECMTLFLDRDNKARLFAADRLLAVMERRAKMFGIDVRPEDDQAGQNYTKTIVLMQRETPDASS